MSEAKWYVVHTYSGYENKVKANIDKTIENRHLEDQILEVRVPLEDVVEIKVLAPEESVFRELIMVKVRANKTERTEIISVADIFRAKIVDVEKDSLMVELTGNGSKVDAFLELLEGYEILELARTGITGLQRGIKDVTVIDQEGNINTL